ncbi:MAG: FKBP-type peptidyl-prolyl cis-trans isomerase [Ornithinimicrobium sp.]
MRSPRVRLLALAAAPIIFLAACSDGDADSDSESPSTSADDSAATSAVADDASATSAPAPDLSALSVEFEENEDEVSVPSILLDGGPFADGELPFTVPTTATEQVTEGEGEQITEGQEVEVRYLLVNGTTGEELLSTFPAEESVVMDLTNTQLLAAFAESLPDQSVGGSYLLAMPPAEGFGETGNANLGIGADDTVVFYVEVVSASEPLTSAEGEEVEPQDGLPTVEADGANAAEITIGDAEEPEDLIVQPLIKGAGPEVQANQTVKVHYTGVKFSDGEQFDSSYTGGQPFSTVIGAGAVIPGWDEGLIGQTVGSRVLLVIPPALAYGEEGDAEEGQPANDLAGESLVFVIDILSAN